MHKAICTTPEFILNLLTNYDLTSVELPKSFKKVAANSSCYRVADRIHGSSWIYNPQQKWNC